MKKLIVRENAGLKDLLYRVSINGQEGCVMDDVEHWFNETNDTEYVITADMAYDGVPITLKREHLQKYVRKERKVATEPLKWYDINEYTPNTSCATVLVAFNDRTPEHGIAACNLGVCIASEYEDPLEWYIKSSDGERMENATKFMLFK